MSERLQHPDAGRFPVLGPAHVRVLPRGTLIGRIHQQAGPHGSPWHGFRAYGPTGSRFDHQPPPPREHPRRAVLYGAAAVTDAPLLRTCLAEVYRDKGVVEREVRAPWFAVFRLARRVRLLDVSDSDWVTLAGGNAGLTSGRRSTARVWSRAIYRRYPDVDGILYACSNVPNARSVVLYERSRRALPDRPALHLALSHPALRADLEVHAVELGLELL